MSMYYTYCSLVFVLAIWVQSCFCFSIPNHASERDVVDLGYAKHNVSLSNITEHGHTIHVYKNIRFAQPPTGSARFSIPRLPPPHVSGLQVGLYDFDTRCVSAVPEGADILFPGLGGTTFGGEDCLFLDVYVPAGLEIDQRVPVLHMIYGSGLAFGSKEFAFTPLGLFDVMLEQGQPFIIVASNYRMGLYGWMSSPNEDMHANSGLLDALIALQWTHQHIGKFGGNSSQITALGQSSGAGSIEMLATSPKLSNDLPFQQAFLSSPALPLKKNVTQRREGVYKSVLEATNCTSLQCLKDVDAMTLAEANRYLLNDVPSMSGGGNTGPGIGFCPVVDGDIVIGRPEALPGLDKVAKGLRRFITANMGSEGEIVSSDQGMPQAFPGLVRRIIPSASDATIEAIQASYVYPDDQPAQLAWQWTADAVYTCHALALTKALPDHSRRYIMTIPPAWHGLDQSYFFFTDNKTTPVADIGLAKDFQRMIGQFLYGEDIQLNQNWPVYGGNSTFLNITASGFKLAAMEKRQLDRCDLINRVFTNPANGI